MDNKYRKYIQAKKNYKMSLLNQTSKIINILNEKFNSLSKKEKQVLNDYKEEGYKQLKTFLAEDIITFEKHFNKLYLFSDEINFKSNEVNLYDVYKNIYYTLKNKINIMDNIFFKKSHVQNIQLFKGVRTGNTLDQLMRLVKNNTPVKTITINEYFSTSLDPNVAFSFMKENKNNIIIQIETERCPYIYLPWEINRTNDLKKENLKNTKGFSFRKSEFEILLPRGIVLEYLGKEDFINNKNNYKNWHNYELRKNNKRKIYIYKFKIVGIKPKKIENIHFYRGEEICFSPEDLKMFYVNKSNLSIVHKKERRRRKTKTPK